MQLVIELINYMQAYSQLAYIIMFTILLACGFGLPLPEDVVLITGGILVSRGVVDFGMTLAVCMAGVLIGDGIIFTIGHKVGPKIKETAFFKRLISVERELMVAQWFAKYGDKVIFFARFAPGLRMPLFMTAGIYKVPYWKFLALDGFAAIISVPVWIWVGDVFGSNLEVLEEKMHQLQMGIYGTLGLVLLVLVLIWLIKKKFKFKQFRP